MSRPLGGYIGHRPVPAAAAANSAAGGMWTLREAQRFKQAATWPTLPAIPQTISGLQLWLDAADPATLFDATTGGSLVAADGGVGRWADKSGNGRHATQATSANRPARKTAVQGGRDVLRFDGSNDFLESTDFLDLTAGQAMTIIAVVKRSATNSTHAILTKYAQTNAADDNTADGWGLRLESTNRLIFFGGTDAGAGNTVRLADSTVDASAFTVLSVKVSAGAISGATLYRNSSTIPSSATASGAETLESTAFPVLIGALMYTNNVPVQFLNGDIAEIIIYNAALSDTDRSAVESYLMSKWAIS